MTCRRRWRALSPRLATESEYAGIHEVVGIEAALQRLQDTERAAQGVGHEPGPVATDAVMVAQGTTVTQHFVGHALPGPTVEADHVVLRSGGEGEVETRAVEVGVRLVDRRHGYSGQRPEGVDHPVTHGGQRGPGARDLDGVHDVAAFPEWG